MIELVFIIVILGILAAVAVPKMAANREDAVAVAIKSDIASMAQAIPAMHMSRGLLSSMNEAINIDGSRWVARSNATAAVAAAGTVTLGTGNAFGVRSALGTTKGTVSTDSTDCASVEYRAAIAADVAGPDTNATVSVGDQLLVITIRGSANATSGCEVLRSMYPLTNAAGATVTTGGAKTNGYVQRINLASKGVNFL